MPERPIGADCKSAGSRLRGFESLPAHGTELLGVSHSGLDSGVLEEVIGGGKDQETRV